MSRPLSKNAQWEHDHGAEDLRGIFIYDPETGTLRRSSNGAPVGTVDRTHGYVRVKFGGLLLLAHRVAYCIHHGYWPVGDTDHINGDRADNRITNLRAVTRSENARNMRRSSNNTSGHTGVSWAKDKNCWAAGARVCGKRHHLGYFADKTEAAKAAAGFRVQNGFTLRHCGAEAAS